VKYMIMMFGSAEEMLETQTSDWVKEMIQFMTDFDQELRDNGELVDNEGLVDGSQAKLVRRTDTGIAVTDGPFAEAKESLVGYWIVDVEDEARVLAISERIVQYSGVVEVRRVADGPPEV
jgi:hypothetical protein